VELPRHQPSNFKPNSNGVKLSGSGTELSKLTRSRFFHFLDLGERERNDRHGADCYV
jgi:hypothetical protein